MNFEVARMATLAETVALCRKLLRGEAVSCGEGTMAQLPRIAPPVPIYVAATGRKMLELAGRIADGVILMNGVAPELICEAVRIVREGTRATEREQESVRIAVWAACHPSRDAVKFNVARAILRNIPGPVDDLTRKVAAQVKQVYDYRQHGYAQADFARLIPDEIVSRYAFFGDPSAIARQIGSLAPCGVDEVVLAIPTAPQIAPRDAVMRDLAPAVLSSGHT
jgi:5,10-methylenetetrahydromethanopterin reductase